MAVISGVFDDFGDLVVKYFAGDFGGGDFVANLCGGVWVFQFAGFVFCGGFSEKVLASVFWGDDFGVFVVCFAMYFGPCGGFARGKFDVRGVRVSDVWVSASEWVCD